MSISGTNQATDSVPFGAVVATGDANANGTAGTPARSDHVHKGVVAADAWTSYTPTLTQSGAVTKTVNYAKYIQLGKTVIVEFTLTVTGTGTGSNAVTVSLPVTAATSGNYSACGSGVILDTSANTIYGGIAVNNTTSAVSFLSTSTDSSNYLGAVVFTAALASGDVVTGSLKYEAA